MLCAGNHGHSRRIFSEKNQLGLITKLTENNRKMEDEVRPKDTQYPRMIFAFYLAKCPTKAACCMPACLVAACVCQTVRQSSRWPSGKAGRRQSFIHNHREFEKAMAVCFQPYPDPMIRDALIIICLLRLKNRGRNLLCSSSQSASIHTSF